MTSSASRSTVTVANNAIANTTMSETFDFTGLPPELQGLILEQALPNELHVSYPLLLFPDEYERLPEEIPKHFSPGWIVHATQPEELQAMIGLLQSSRETRAEMKKAIKRKDTDMTLVVDLRHDLLGVVAPGFDTERYQVPPALYQDWRHLRIIMPVGIDAHSNSLHPKDPYICLLTLELERAPATAADPDAWTVVSHVSESVMQPSNFEDHRNVYDLALSKVISLINTCVRARLRGPLTRWRLEKIIQVLWTGQAANSFYDQAVSAGIADGETWEMLTEQEALAGYNVATKGRTREIECIVDLDAAYHVPVTIQDQQAAQADPERIDRRLEFGKFWAEGILGYATDAMA